MSKRAVELAEYVDGVTERLRKAMTALANTEASIDWVKGADPDGLADWGEDMASVACDIESLGDELAESARAVVRHAESLMPDE